MKTLAYHLTDNRKLAAVTTAACLGTWFVVRLALAAASIAYELS